LSYQAPTTPFPVRSSQIEPEVKLKADLSVASGPTRYVCANVINHHSKKETEMRNTIASRTFAIVGLGITLALGAATAGSAIASNESEKYGSRSEYTTSGESSGSTGSALSMGQILAKVKERGFTEIYEVERERGVYEVKTRDAEGRLMELYLDAKTGEVLKSEYED
jgi:uncharacterized membrane protein YkoI